MIIKRYYFYLSIKLPPKLYIIQRHTGTIYTRIVHIQATSY